MNDTTHKVSRTNKSMTAMRCRSPRWDQVEGVRLVPYAAVGSTTLFVALTCLVARKTETNTGKRPKVDSTISGKQNFLFYFSSTPVFSETSITSRIAAPLIAGLASIYFVMFFRKQTLIREQATSG